MQTLKTIREIVDTAAERYGSRDAFRYKEKGEVHAKSYLEMQRAAYAFGRSLQKLEVSAHVAVIGPTTWQWIAAYLGTVCSGRVIVPLDAQLPPKEICELLARCDAEVFVFDELYLPLLPAVQASCPNVKHFFCLQTEKDEDGVYSFHHWLEENQGDCAADIDPEKLCAILYTSGTTGKSKGVMLNNRNIADNVCCVDFPYNGDNTVILSVLPVHHAYCFTCDILLGMMLGIPICINDSLMRLAKNMQLFQPSLMLMVPMIVESIYKQVSLAAKANPGVPKAAIAQAALGGKLKNIYSGGAYLDPALVDAYAELGITLLQGYGMTECAPRISSNSEQENKQGSVGKLVDGCQVKTVEGEIWAKSDSVMMGYYHDPENTAATLEDGWLKTGDLGYVDEDGFLFLTGRKKNLIILSNGENISPEELENLLHREPLVAEVLVYGEKNVITAEIYPDQEAIAGTTDIRAALQAVIDRINEDQPPYKKIGNLIVRDAEFEKTPSKKIKRKYS